jgi:hypothetical protein
MHASETWAKYGLTIAQVAEVYGVAVGVIERILRQVCQEIAASDPR